MENDPKLVSDVTVQVRVIEMRAVILIATLVGCQLSLTRGCGDRPLDDDVVEREHPLVRRDANPDTRKGCAPGESSPVQRVSTGARLSGLRNYVRQEYDDIAALVVPSGDSHQSEYIAAADKRIKWISGFSGSSAFAVVTQSKAALWTDGRYYLQAENQLDCNWLFMRGAEGGDGGWIDWLASELPPESRIGADPTLTGAFTWLKWEEKLAEYKLRLVALEDNPIDQVWVDRPKRNSEELEVHELAYAGKSWQDKIADLRSDLFKKGHDAMILTGLDEIAWLFNLRGADIPYTPVFRGYAVVSIDRIYLYIPVERQTRKVRDHLNAVGDCGSSDKCVEIRDYDAIFSELKDVSTAWDSLLLAKKWAYTGGASYAIYRMLPMDKVKFDLSPVMLMKARKNEVETAAMIRANELDAVAVIDLAARLEDGIATGEHWSELKVSFELLKRRAEQKDFKMASFETIAAFGANGAVIHYKPNNATNTRIDGSSLFLLDSGGQYKGGTTDVTRTFHYGTPTNFQREAYTRVLMGSIDLARVTFMKGTTDSRLDILARWHLHRVGLNYRHGTGHGIGMYGLIHESPVQVRVYQKEEHALEVGHFFSDEPGYYQAGEFGIRLETVLRVVERRNLKYQEKDDYGTFLGFEPVCLVPFEPKLIDYELLNEGHREWLNRYNSLVRQKIGKELKAQGRMRAFEWMMERTEPIPQRNINAGKAVAPLLRSISMISVFALHIFIR